MVKETNAVKAIDKLMLGFAIGFPIFYGLMIVVGG